MRGPGRRRCRGRPGRQLRRWKPRRDLRLRPGADRRRPGRPSAAGQGRQTWRGGGMRADLETAGVPIAAELAEPALAEGGDTLWLDGETLVVGLGYRTNEAGADQMA